MSRKGAWLAAHLRGRGEENKPPPPPRPRLALPPPSPSRDRTQRCAERGGVPAGANSGAAADRAEEGESGDGRSALISGTHRVICRVHTRLATSTRTRAHGTSALHRRSPRALRLPAPARPSSPGSPAAPRGVPLASENTLRRRLSSVSDPSVPLQHPPVPLSDLHCVWQPLLFKLRGYFCQTPSFIFFLRKL